ncbi:MAG: regulator [Gammaproteobacteria bacterium]|nr:regulator [Gammaproteobacteria bacterium]
MTAAAYRFDDRRITYHPFGNYRGFVYTLLDVNVEQRTVELLFKFEPNAECFYHRHVAPTTTLVLEGEQRIREPDGKGGEIVKVRPAGSFAVGTPGDVHIEGGGPEGATLFLSIRGETDHIYDLLNDDLSIRHSVSIQQFRQTFEEMRGEVL